jgi:undecaprenyl-diphosphatase
MVVIVAAFSGLGFAVKSSLPWTDWAVLEWFVGHRSPPLNVFAMVITYLGSAWVLVPVVAAAALFAEANRDRSLAIFVIVSGSGAALMVQAIKLIVERARPSVGHLTVVQSPDFPSGHAANSTAVYLALVWVAALSGRPRAPLLAGWAAVVVIAVVCWSRLYLGVHYLSDVVAGCALGLLWVTVSMVVLGIGRPSAHQRR